MSQRARAVLHVVAALGVLLACGGCLPIPHHHTLRPAARFVVRDAAGQPVAGARVHLYSALIVGKRVRFADSAATDSAGTLSFRRRRELHPLIVLAPDGEAPWIWGWCADAPGMSPAYGRVDAPPHETIAVVLERAAPAKEDACPVNPGSLYDLPTAPGR